MQDQHSRQELDLRCLQESTKWQQDLNKQTSCLTTNESKAHIIKGKCPIYMDIREKYYSLEDDDKGTAELEDSEAQHGF